MSERHVVFISHPLLTKLIQKYAKNKGFGTCLAVAEDG